MDFTSLAEFMDHLTDWRIPGNSCVVYKDRKPVFRYSSGYSDIESKKKMCGDEIMYMYSATKPVVCTAAMTLWEKGKFDLDDKLEIYLPEWADITYRAWDDNGNFEYLPVPADRRATVRDLFRMTAGLDYNVNRPALQEAIKKYSPECPTREIARALAKDPMCFLPGDHWNYSLCHDVLGALVEVIADMPLADYVKKTILDPLGMKETEFGMSDERRKRMATLYCFNDDTKSIDREPSQSNWSIFGTKYHSGGAGITSTVEDMALFTEMMAAGGVSQSGERIIASRTLDLLRSNQLGEQALKDVNWSHLVGYGYGLGVRTMMDPAKGGATSPVGEYGWTGAAGAYMMIDPENSLAVFYAHHMLNNQEYYTAPRIRNIVYSCLEK
ncbi:MAG: beta-lactamase family protein [Clostridia bacterium]|nr:beta-lactamase family protein [Clostridia bacterium]